MTQTRKKYEGVEHWVNSGKATPTCPDTDSGIHEWVTLSKPGSCLGEWKCRMCALEMKMDSGD
jgi:hypothetical protein